MFFNRISCIFSIPLCLATVSVSGFQSVPSKAAATRDRSNVVISLRGGDNIETQSEEDALIKFYTLKGGMCPYAARTWITLLELGLPFETIEVSREEKDDW